MPNSILESYKLACAQLSLFPKNNGYLEIKTVV